MKQQPRAGARRAALAHPLATQLARQEYERVLAQLRGLPAQAWTAPTDCPAWDVRQLACHLLGMMEMAASVRELARQQRAAKRAGGDPLDALTALQVAERADWSPDQIMDRFAARIPAAVAGRRRTPALVRGRRLPQVQRVGGAQEWWTIGFLTDVILTRDPWMHRVDIARATGATLELTPEHDGMLLADIVAEWAARHGRPVQVTLDGPAGGQWTYGSGGPAVRADAIEFARALAGRPTGLDDAVTLGTAVPY